MSWSATKMIKLVAPVRALAPVLVLAPLLALASLLGACSDIYTDRRDTIGLSAGNALASDKAIQTIDPWPPASADRNIAYNGQKMQKAVERYRTGHVIPPKPLTTNSSFQADAQAPAGVGGPPQ
jgi:hypothetical protein